MQTTPRISAWSASRLKDFEKCRFYARLKHADKIPDPTPKPAADRGSRIHKDAELFVQGNGPLTPELEPIKDNLIAYQAAYADGLVELEGEWGFDIDWKPIGYFDPNVWARVKLDLLLRPSPTDALVVDYKTGKKFGNEVPHAQQGQIYEVSTFLRYPEIQTITTTFLYPDQKDKTVRTITREKSLLTALPSITRRALALTTCTDFRPSPNKHNCKWCPYKPSGTGHCPVGVDS